MEVWKLGPEFKLLCRSISLRMVIWQVGGPIHTDLWAHGGSRPVYLVRFAQRPGTQPTGDGGLLSSVHLDEP